MSIDHDDGQGHNPRVRRTTIETFNAELAVLDRPLEDEVEYYDEPPRPSRRWMGTAVGVAGMLGSIAAFVLTRPSTSDVNAGADGARPRVAAVIPGPTPAAAPSVGTAADPYRGGSAVAPAASDPTNDGIVAPSESSSPGSHVGPSRLQPSHRVWVNWGRAAPEPEAPANTPPPPHRLIHHGRHH